MSKPGVSSRRTAFQILGAVLRRPMLPAVYALWRRPSLEPRSEGASERSPGFVLPVGSAAPAE